MKTKKSKAMAFALAGVIGVSGLSVYATASENSYEASRNEHLTMSTLWYQKSGEMKALYYQAYHLGKMVVDNRLAEREALAPNGNGKHVGDKHVVELKKPAIVLDIDETVLDNSPHTAYSIKEGVDYPTGWSEWIASAQAEALPGAVEFLKYVDSKGVDIFYVSNRTQAEKEATMKNLEAKGFPQVTQEHVSLRTAESSKENRRLAIEKDHEIIALFGDNLADFAKDFDKAPLEQRNDAVERLKDEFGDKFIVLPNPMYGDWEGAVYGYNFGKSSAEKDQARKGALKVFDPSK